jgi:NAD(P)-dependent dehydrogenase (short-subunit alcohol dehydrogenase family)
MGEDVRSVTECTRRRLEGRTAIVTGAGQGIGQAIARRLAREGADVCVVGRSRDSLEVTVKTIADEGGRTWAATADISKEDQVEAALTAATDRWGRIDVLVNNAAVFDEAPFFDLDVDTFRRTFEINVTGTFIMSRGVARQMAAAGGGSIIHISSIDALGADGPFTAYSATKAAVVSMARTMTLELAPLGIRVNCVAPGFVNTDMVHKTSTQNVLDHMLHGFTRVPLGRLIEADEIGAAVAFLASDESSGITGTNIVVDGGLTSNLYVMETLPEPMIPLGGS